MSESEWITVRQFVAHTNGALGYSTVTRMLRNGQLDGVLLSPRKWVIKRSALDDFIARKREQGV